MLQAKALVTQSQVQEALGASAKVAQALLDQLTAKAANLETVLEDTTVRFNDLPIVSGVLGIRLSPWTLCSLLFAIIAVQNPKAAVLVVLCGGKFTVSSHVMNPLTPILNLGLLFASRFLVYIFPFIFQTS